MNENNETPVTQEEPVVTEENNVTETSANVNPGVTKKKSKTGLIVVIVLLVLLIGVGVWYFVFYKKDTKEELPPKKENVTEVESLYNAADYTLKDNNISNFDLLFLQMDNNSNNKVYSPLSIKYALQMLSEGSDGETKEEIDTLLGDYTTKKYTNSEHLTLANALFVRNSYKDNILDTYVDTLKTSYNADVVYDNFETAKVLNTWVCDHTFNLIQNILNDGDIQDYDYALVNALAIDMNWNYAIQNYSDYGMNEEDIIPSKYASVGFDHETVKNDNGYEFTISAYSGTFGENYIKFNGSDDDIPVAKVVTAANRYDIVSDLGKDTIINNISADFDKYLNENPDQREYCENTIINTTYEELSSNYNKFDYSTDYYFYYDDDVKAFAKDLQTYDGTTLEYVGIMPTSVELNEYVDNITSDKINNIINSLKDGGNINSFEDGKITVLTAYIPMFDFDYDLDLTASLQKMGIKSVFNPTTANLSKLTESSGSYIASVKHAANIEFSNFGIKAAAVTVAGGKGSAGPGCFYNYNYNVEDKYVEVDLSFNKPYLFIIRDKDSGEVWFTGTVYEPATELDETGY